MTTEVIDSTAEEITTDLAPVRPASSQEVLRPLDITQQREAMDLYQAGLRSLLDDTDWQRTNREQFVKKSGWRKIAAWFNLNLELLRDTVERADDGSASRAMVWARAVAPNGRYADGDGYCDVAESRFSGPRGNRSKLENDLRATATTRAVNRAISNLVGMGAVSAEEVDGGDQQPAGPPFGPEASDALTASAESALAYLVDSRTVAGAALAEIATASGYLPAVVAGALRVAAGHAKKHRDAEIGGDATPAPEGAEEAQQAKLDELNDKSAEGM